MRGGLEAIRGNSGAAVAGYLHAEDAGPGARLDDYWRDGGRTQVVRHRTMDGEVSALSAMTPSQTEAWVEGYDPETGESRMATERTDATVLAWEAAVNVPRSLATAVRLAGCEEELFAAVEAAADAVALEMAETVTARLRHDGQRFEVGVTQLEDIRVRHHTNRSGQWAPHMHQVFSARVLADDGQWRAMWLGSGQRSGILSEIVHRVRGAGELALHGHEPLRQALAAAGWEIAADGSVKDLVATDPALSARTVQIEANRRRYEGAWQAQHPDETPGPRLRRSWDRRAWEDGRPRKVAGLPADDLRARWDADLAEALDVAGIDASDAVCRPAVDSGGCWVGTVDIDELAAAALSRAATKHSVLSENALAAAVSAEAAAWQVVGPPGALLDLRREVTTRALAMTVRADDLAPLPTDIPATVGGWVRRYIAPEVIETHQATQRDLEAMVATGGSRLEPAEMARAFASTEQVDVERLDDGQCAAAAAIAGSEQLVIVESAAGSGKTTMLQAARVLLDAQGRSMVVVAPSKTAADVAAAEIGTEGRTVHALLHDHGYRWDSVGRWRQLAVGDLDPRTGAPWSGPARPLQVGSVVTVDEAGMVDAEVGRRLLAVVRSSGAELRLVGDRHQLPAVGRGGFLTSAVGWVTPIDLGQVHRFVKVNDEGVRERDREYADLTLSMRSGEHPEAVFGRLVATGRASAAGADDQERRTEILRAWGTHRRLGRDVLIVADTNAEAAALSSEVRRLRVDRGEVEEGGLIVSNEHTGNMPQFLGVGDRIITRSNTRDGANNQERWTVQRLTPDGDLVVRGGIDGRTLTLDREWAACHTHLGYAVTAHAAQGQTTDVCLVSLTPGTTAAGVYVPMSRGRLHNEAFIAADDLGDAQNLWCRAATCDRSDQGLMAELELARAEIAGAPRSVEPGSTVADATSTDEYRAADARLELAIEARDRAASERDRVQASARAAELEVYRLQEALRAAEREASRATMTHHRAKADVQEVRARRGPKALHRKDLDRATAHEADAAQAQVQARERRIQAKDRLLEAQHELRQHTDYTTGQWPHPLRGEVELRSAEAELRQARSARTEDQSAAPEPTSEEVSRPRM
jgi:hypothetical protein